MNTAELYIEPILIGALMLVLLALPFAPELLELARSKELEKVGGISIGVMLIGLAYFVGILVDRLVDSCLQPLERHNRIRFALTAVQINHDDCLDTEGHRKKIWADKKAVLRPNEDLFPEDQYRWRVYAEADKIADSLDYIRTRIRLIRTLTFLLPGLIFAGVLGAIRLKWAFDCALPGHFGPKLGWCVLPHWTMPSPSGISWASFFAPGVYALTIAVALAVPWLDDASQRKKAERCRIRAGMWNPPDTRDLKRIDRYLEARRWPLGTKSRKNLFIDGLVQPIVLCSFVLIVASVPLVFWLTGSWPGAVIAGLAGGALVYAAGWSWWRISQTYMSYLKGAGQYLERKDRKSAP